MVNDLGTQTVKTAKSKIFKIIQYGSFISIKEVNIMRVILSLLLLSVFCNVKSAGPPVNWALAYWQTFFFFIKMLVSFHVRRTVFSISSKRDILEETSLFPRT